MNNYTDYRPVVNVLFHPRHPEIFECAYNRHGRYSKQCLVPGLIVEILSFIAKKANFTLNFILEPKDIYDYDETCLRMNNETIDIFGITVRSMDSLKNNCDISEPLYSMQPVIFTRSRDRVGQGWWNMLTIYNPYSWCFVLASILLESAFIFWIHRVEQRFSLRSTVSAKNIIWKIFRIQLFQSEGLHCKLASGTISVTLFSLLHGSIILGIYSSSCLSALMRKPDLGKIRSEGYIFGQLRKGKRKLVSFNTLDKFREQIFNRSEQKFLELQRAVGKHGLEGQASVQGILTSFHQKGNYVYDYRTSGIGLKLLESCSTMTAHIDFPSISRHLLLSKNNPHTQTINRIIQRNQMKIKAIYQSYIDRITPKVCTSYKVGNPLKLNFYYGILIVCGGILAVSIGFLIMERVYYKWKEAEERRRHPRLEECSWMANDSSKRPWRVLFKPQKPDIYECTRHIGPTDRKCLYPGVMVEIIALLAKVLDYRVEFVLDSNLTYDYKNLCKTMKEHQFDMFGVAARETDVIKVNCDVSAAMYEVQPYLFVRPRDSTTHGWWNMFLIYDLISWGSILLIFTTECTFLYVVYITQRTIGKEGIKFKELVWQMIRIQLFQSDEIRLNLLSGMFSLSIFALFQGTIIFGLYTSWTLSSLMRLPDYSKLRSTNYVYNQLATGKQKFISLGPYKNFWESIFTRTEPAYIELQRQLRNNSLVVYDSPEDLIKAFSKDPHYLYAYATSDVGLQIRRYCDTLMTDVALPSITRHIYLQKNSSYTEAINQAIIENRQHIITIHNRYIERNIDVECHRFKLGDPIRLRFYNGLLIICCSITMLSIVTLIIELLVKKLKLMR